jgi:hypothetical protein
MECEMSVAKTGPSLLDRLTRGRTDLVFDLIEQGHAATARHDGASLISWCARYGDVTAIRFLLSKGERLESLGPNLGLDAAAYHGHWRLCEFLLENGADVNYADPGNGETALHAALCTANRPAFASEATIERLLDAGARVDASDANGESPLAWASWHTRPDPILRLLCYGDHYIRPDRDSSFDHGTGWGFMERDLLGVPHRR